MPVVLKLWYAMRYLAEQFKKNKDKKQRNIKIRMKTKLRCMYGAPSGEDYAIVFGPFYIQHHSFQRSYLKQRKR